MAPAAFVAEGEEALGVSPLTVSAYRHVARLTMPIRMLLGSADQIVQHALQSLALAPFLSDVEVEWIEGVGHMVHQCSEERVVRQIEKLLRASRQTANSSAGNAS
jgi:pimeloyl-ACP methyl ester carboxylesterase